MAWSTNRKNMRIEDLLKKFPQEERVYRLRCVEAWSMVIPWNGFPLASLLKEVEPTSDAKYVRFETVLRPDQMPGQTSPFYPWPYQEGLRLDEAMHDLTLLATGLYGQPMPNPNGAPIRLVVPWKYGFKSIKSIVKIELVAEQPTTLWSMVGPGEYGFYSNVNPNRPHPRWSQASERRIGELGRRETLMFNGYGEQVASLYKGMDLIKDYYNVLAMTNKYKSVPVKSFEITPHSLYLSRREFLKAAGLVSGSALLAACAPNATETSTDESPLNAFPVKKDEFGDPANSFEDITHYNNFYEFSENKEAVYKLSKDFKSHPWTVEVYGLVNQTAKICDRRFAQKISAGRTCLPSALCGSLEHGHPLDGFSTCQPVEGS